MTDRELLELAAKAAGINIQMWEAVDPYRMKASGAMVVWNPLTDDGDALRLAVRLIKDYGFEMEEHNYALCFGSDSAEYCVEVPWNNDPYAATRRAIVRAAAEIGKGVK